jgi:hypothetical protein
MQRKKPNPVFEVLFAKAFPEEIPVTVLSRTLSAINQLSLGELVRTSRGEEEESEDDNAAIRLISIRRGSAVFQCYASRPDAAIANLRIVGDVIATPNPDSSDRLGYILHPVEELSAIAKSQECAIIVRAPAGKKQTLAVVEPDSYARIAKSFLIEGDTTIRGSIEKVGGATDMRCSLRVPFQHRLLFCGVASAELSRKLGQHLYETVAAVGTAKWIQRSWKIFAFTIKDIYQPKPRSIREAVKALREAGGKSWDKIKDPEAYLAEIGARP